MAKKVKTKLDNNESYDEDRFDKSKQKHSTNRNRKKAQRALKRSFE